MLAAVTFAVGLAVGITLGATAFRRAKPAVVARFDTYALADKYEAAARKLANHAHGQAAQGNETWAKNEFDKAEEFVQRAEELRRKALEP